MEFHIVLINSIYITGDLSRRCISPKPRLRICICQGEASECVYCMLSQAMNWEFVSVKEKYQCVYCMLSLSHGLGICICQGEASECVYCMLPWTGNLFGHKLDDGGSSMQLQRDRGRSEREVAHSIYSRNTTPLQCHNL